jgi:hypothetical protein
MPIHKEVHGVPRNQTSMAGHQDDDISLKTPSTGSISDISSLVSPASTSGSSSPTNLKVETSGFFPEETVLPLTSMFSRLMLPAKAKAKVKAMKPDKAVGDLAKEDARRRKEQIIANLHRQTVKRQPVMFL